MLSPEFQYAPRDAFVTALTKMGSEGAIAETTTIVESAAKKTTVGSAKAPTHASIGAGVWIRGPRALMLSGKAAEAVIRSYAASSR